MCDRRIFIVEQEPGQGLALEAELASSRFDNLEWFTNGEELVQFCAKHLGERPEAVIIDGSKNLQAALSLTRKLKALLPNVIVVVISQGRRMTESLKALAAGATNCLRKTDPSYMEELVEILRYWLEDFLPRVERLEARI